MATLKDLIWRESVGDVFILGAKPQNRFAVPCETLETIPAPQKVVAAPAVMEKVSDILSNAEGQVEIASSLEELKAIIERFEGSPLKKSALHTVFGKGNPKAKIVFVGEAPGAEEDKQGIPFVGEAGRLLDKMIASIGLSWDEAYITNVLPWRPAGNRTPTMQEVAMMMPFLRRHLELISPDIIVTLGGVAASALLDRQVSITRLRGNWQSFQLKDREVALLPTFHPAYLLRSPIEKAKAWLDLKSISARLLGVN